ncbi:MAG TPA: glycosyltransferase family 1 protein [Gemmatimonadales bacterium]|nr:glycosyltransferase family 1 protein [Gemmatimonadales bacterium]
MAPVEVVVNARYLSGTWTGTEVYMARLLQALSETEQVRVCALTWAPLHMNLPGVHEIIPARRPNFRAGSIPAVLWKLWFDQWYALRVVSKNDGLLYHGMDGFLPYSLRRRDSCVATVHDLGWQVHPELFDHRLRLMYGSLFPWVLRRADRFIAVSRYTADDLMRRSGVPASRIDVIYHGLDPLFSAVKQSSKEAEAGPYLLAVGGVSPRKNTRRLIEAFRAWRAKGGHRAQFRLLITGTSLDSEFVRGAPLPEGVSLLGYVAKEDLPGLYAGAAAFLYPGIYEGFGLPIIEAMACGTPVVTSTTGAAPEIAGGAAVLVDPFDVESIARGIERVTLAPEGDRLSALGRQRVGMFDWSTAASETIEVYRMLQR